MARSAPLLALLLSACVFEVGVQDAGGVLGPAPDGGPGDDVDQVDAAVPATMAIDWALTREATPSNTPTTCLEGNVTSVRISVLRAGEHVAMHDDVYDCVLGATVLGDLQPGTYAVRVQGYTGGGTPRGEPAERIIQVTGGGSITPAPFELVLPAGATVLATWELLQDGLPVDCDAVPADLAWLETWKLGEPARGGAASCASGALLLTDVEAGTYQLKLTLGQALGGNPLALDPGVVLAASASVPAGDGLVHVPLVVELFDEPAAQLQQIADAASSYQLVNGEFPVGTVGTDETCCSNLPDFLCPADPAEWLDPTWVALGFDVTGRGRFTYTYTGSGTGALATFTARAYADLDCDGTKRVHEVTGAIAGDGSVVITGPAALTTAE